MNNELNIGTHESEPKHSLTSTLSYTDNRKLHTPAGVGVISHFTAYHTVTTDPAHEILNLARARRVSLEITSKPDPMWRTEMSSSTPPIAGRWR